MPDEPSFDSQPVPIRPRTAPSERTGPARAIVHDLRTSLRAADAYVRMLVDRIELSCTSGLVRLDAVPADALVRLTALSEALQGEADCVLGHIDPSLARTARTVADLVRDITDAEG